MGKDEDRRDRRGSDSKLISHRAEPGEANTPLCAGEEDLPEEGRMDTHVSLRDKSSNVAKIHAAAEVYVATSPQNGHRHSRASSAAILSPVGLVARGPTAKLASERAVGTSQGTIAWAP